MADPVNLNINSALQVLSKLPEYVHVVWLQHAPDQVQKPLSSVAEKLGISEQNLICILCVLIFGILPSRKTELFFTILSTAYPAYASFKALEAACAEGESHEEIQRWLKYWVVFAILAMMDFMMPRFISSITSFWLIKSVTVFWCMLPVQPNGSEVLYSTFIGPIFKSLRQSVGC